MSESVRPHGPCLQPFLLPRSMARQQKPPPAPCACHWRGDKNELFGGDPLCGRGPRRRAAGRSARRRPPGGSAERARAAAAPLAAGTGTVRRAWLRRHVVAAPSPAASPFPSVTIPASRWVFATLPSPFSPLKAEMPSAPQRAGLLCFQGGCWPSRESPSSVQQVAAAQLWGWRAVLPRRERGVQKRQAQPLHVQGRGEGRCLAQTKVRAGSQHAPMRCHLLWMDVFKS